jgi:hypothetical protein
MKVSHAIIQRIVTSVIKANDYLLYLTCCENIFDLFGLDFDAKNWLIFDFTIDRDVSYKEHLVTKVKVGLL